MEIHADGTRLLIAAGYIRESTKIQAQGYAPELQLEGIRQAATQNGYVLPGDRIRTDYERGSKISRKGYQEIVDWVRAGEVSAVFVYTFDRFGRNAGEWLSRYDEFRKYKASLFSVKEGEAKGFLVPAIHASMAQEYSVNLAAKVTPARERAAQDGKHMGPTPVGYVRVYPERRGDRLVKYQSGLLVEDTAASWWVRELFERWVSGSYTLRMLSAWANTVAGAPEPPQVGAWTIDGIKYILKNPVYMGMIRYNKRPQGVYEQTADGTGFVQPGLHEGLVMPELFEAAQERLRSNRGFAGVNRESRPVPMAAGLLVCSGCGGPMRYVRRSTDINREGDTYTCVHRAQGRVDCTASGYAIRHAHAALLQEIKRLRPNEPLEPLSFEPVKDEAEETRGRLERGLAKLQEERQRLARTVMQLGALDDGMVEAFRLESTALAKRARELEELLTHAPPQRLSTVTMQELDRQIRETNLAEHVEWAEARGDWIGLRELCLSLVASATVTRRVPAFRSRWLKLEVTWVPEAAELLAQGVWSLAPSEPAPDVDE